MPHVVDLLSSLPNMKWFSLARGLDRRFQGGVSAVEQLIGELSEVCAGLPDQRKGPRRDGDYTMTDIGLAAFSIFFMGSPSFPGTSERWTKGTAGRTARHCSPSLPLRRH
jgi:hypothetical protein